MDRDKIEKMVSWLIMFSPDKGVYKAHPNIDEMHEFIIAELTKLLDGYYIPKEEILDYRGIIKICNRVTEKSRTWSFFDIAKALVGKVAKPKKGIEWKDVERVARVIINKEYIPAVCEDSGQAEWSIGEATKLAKAIIKELED